MTYGMEIFLIVEDFGCYTYWHGEERLITVHGDGFIIEMEVDEPYYTIVLADGTRSARTSFIDNIGPMIIDGRAFLPLRSLAENLGYTAEWNNDSALAILTSGTGRRSF